MTKAQIKAAIQNRFNEVCNARYENTILKELQELNAYHGSGERWCSYQENLKGIIKGGNEKAIGRAFSLYEEWLRIDAAESTMNRLVIDLHCLDF